jgi:molybdopterin-containing oxidoreductase family iron-sulfur binding subunit
MDQGRRNFLKKTGIAALGIGCGFPLLRTTANALEDPHGEGAPTTSQLAMVIDVQKCLNPEVIRACSDACHQEHNVPDIADPNREVKWIWPEKYGNAFPDQVHAFTEDALKDKPVLVLCNHCTSPSCVRVCPTQATWKRESDGIVMMDMHRCIGCRYCIAACPYGARSFNWQDPRPHIKGKIHPEFPTRTKGVVEKCNFCAERLAVGRPPACVEAANRVPGGQGALTFGDLSDPSSEVVGVLRSNHTIRRKPTMGTGPNVFYIV